MMTKELSKILYGLIGAILAGSGAICYGVGNRGDAEGVGATFMIAGIVFLFPLVKYHVGKFLEAAMDAQSNPPRLEEPPKDSSSQ